MFLWMLHMYNFWSIQSYSILLDFLEPVFFLKSSTFMGFTPGIYFTLNESTSGESSLPRSNDFVAKFASFFLKETKSFDSHLAWIVDRRFRLKIITSHIHCLKIGVPKSLANWIASLPHILQLKRYTSVNIAGWKFPLNLDGPYHEKWGRISMVICQWTPEGHILGHK